MNARDEDQELLARLKEFKVETDLDLLTLNTDLILSRHGDVIDRERLLALIARTREWHAAKTLTGQQDFRIQGQLRQLQFKTGIYQIDKLLDGGLYAGDLVEIAGRPKSGRRSVGNIMGFLEEPADCRFLGHVSSSLSHALIFYQRQSTLAKHWERRGRH